jgi:oligopeptide/dipeptide ABC transporter ATP-binding protein
MIAMAISCEPKLLIADEPTTALDVTIQAQILELLKTIQARTKSSLILITHDLGVVADMVRNVLVMYAGQAVEEGTVEEVLLSPRMPYTMGLIESIPSVDKRGGRLSAIKGTVPSPFHLPPACRFQPRCPFAWDLCQREPPELYSIGGGRHARCLLHTKQANPVSLERFQKQLAVLQARAAGAEAPAAAVESPAAGQPA